MIQALVLYLWIKQFVGATASLTLSPSLAPTPAPSTSRSTKYSVSLFAGTGTSASTGTGGRATSASFSNLRSVWLDTAGVVYVGESSANCVRSIDASGIVHSFAGICGSSGSTDDGGAATSALLKYCGTIFVSSTGNLYLSDNNNSKVRMVSTSSTMSTVVGTGTGVNSGDGGKATSAGLNDPFGIWSNSVGTLYIECTLGQLIRSVDSSNIIRSFAGMRFIVSNT